MSLFKPEHMSIEEIIDGLTFLAEDAFEGQTENAEYLTAAITRLKTHPEAQTNEPLTLEELRKMDGQPVWVKAPGVSNDISGRWVIVEGVDLEDRTIYTRGDFACHDYGAVWLAYRRPPKED